MYKILKCKFKLNQLDLKIMLKAPVDLINMNMIVKLILMENSQ